MIWLRLHWQVRQVSSYSTFCENSGTNHRVILIEAYLNIEWKNLKLLNNVWYPKLRNESLLLQAFSNKWEGTGFDLRCSSIILKWMHDAVGNHSTLKGQFAKRLNCVSTAAASVIFPQMFSYFFSIISSKGDVALYEANLRLRIIVRVNRTNELLPCDFAESSNSEIIPKMFLFFSFLTLHTLRPWAPVSCASNAYLKLRNMFKLYCVHDHPAIHYCKRNIC